jgi:hypothetical protein
MPAYGRTTAGIVEDAELEGVELVDLGAQKLKGLPREQRLFQVRVEGLRTDFDRLRIAEAPTPGVATFVAAASSGGTSTIGLWSR